ncbi:MAG: hypothetical protein U0Z53_10055 [Blastocatellia bacterium]
MQQPLKFTWPIFLMLTLTTMALAQQPFRLADREVKPLLERLEDRTDHFRDALSKGLKKSRINYGSGEESLPQYVEDLRVSARRLKDRFDGKRSVAADVEEVLRRAVYIDRFMHRHPVVTGADREWTEVRQQLETLGRAWNVRWDEDGPENRPSRLNDQEVVSLVETIKRNSAQLRDDADKSLKGSRGVDNQTRKNISDTLGDLAKSADRLRSRVSDAKEAPRQVDELLRLGATIDRFIDERRISGRVQSDWSVIRAYLTQLARTYNVRW